MAAIIRSPSAKYKVVPLKYENIGVAAIQMNPKAVDIKNPQKGIKENLEHLLFLCDATHAWVTYHINLVAFPEFTLTGFDTTWTREDWLKVAIMVPGPETELIGKKAKELGYYIEFASHTQDPDWPGHFFNTSVLVSPEGKVIHTHWKAYGGAPGFGPEYNTTIHDVLDEFVARYGWDAVWPVARTEIGNIATFICSEGFVPETARAFAFNGAEILVRSFGGGGNISDSPRVGDHMVRMRSDCAASHVYGVYSGGGSGWKIMGKDMVENAGGGGSMVIDPFGRVLKKAVDSREQIVAETIPIAAYRSRHQIPSIRTEIYAPVLEQHPGRFPPNMYSKYLPTDHEDARRWALKNARW